jgi:E3 SUMO-protein ligase PIAS1
MPHPTCNFKNRARPGFVLFATIQHLLRAWPSTSKNPNLLAYQKHANFCCRYVKNILKSTSRSVDQVTIQPDGRWELNSKKESMSRTNGVASDDDDDLVEITKSGDSVRMSTPRTYGTPVSTLPQASAASSAMGSSSSGKRPIAAVIDLTSSGDEDDELLARPPKRQQTNGYGVMLPAYRPPTNGY